MNSNVYQICFLLLVSCIVTYISSGKVPDEPESNNWSGAPDVTQFTFNYTDMLTFDKKRKNILKAALSMDMQTLYGDALCHVAEGDEMGYSLHAGLLYSDYYGKQVLTDILGFCEKPSFGVTNSSVTVTPGSRHNLFLVDVLAETFVTTNWRTTLIEGDLTAQKLDQYGKAQMSFDGFLEFAVKQMGLKVMANYLITFERQKKGKPAIKKCLEDLLIVGVDPKFEMVNCVSDEMQIGTKGQNGEIDDICINPPQHLSHVCQEVTDELCVRLYEDIIYHMFEKSVVQLYNHVQESLPLCNYLQF